MKKGLLATLVALLLAIGATQILRAQEEQKGCCPACNPPDTCCCK